MMFYKNKEGKVVNGHGQENCQVCHESFSNHLWLVQLPLCRKEKLNQMAGLKK